MPRSQLTPLARMIGAFCAGVVASILFHNYAMKRTVEPGPGPDTQIVAHGKGTNVVVVLDDSSPSIPIVKMIDDPVTRGLRKAGMFTLAYLRADKEWLEQTKKYDRLYDPSGGVPMMVVLDRENKTDNLVYAGRQPTDFRTRDEIFAKSIGNLPPPLPISEIPPPNVKRFGLDPGYKLSLKEDAAKYGSYPKFGDKAPLLPQSEWREFNTRDIFNGDLIFDQGQHNSCVGNAGTGSFEYLMWWQGMKLAKLAPACLYYPINDGQDEGASISATIGALQKKGVCRFDLWGKGPLRGQDPVFLEALEKSQQREVVRDALNYRLDDQGGLRLTTWEDICSALQAGMPVTLSVFVGDGSNPKFFQFDDDGVCGIDLPPLNRGGGLSGGNHAVRVDGMRFLKDRNIWVLDMVNSWKGYGAWSWADQTNRGRAYITKEHLFNARMKTEAIAYRAAARRVGEPNDPPAYVGKYAAARAAADVEVALAP